MFELTTRQSRFLLPWRFLIQFAVGITGILWAPDDVISSELVMSGGWTENAANEPRIEGATLVSDLTDRLEQLERENAELAVRQHALVDQLETMSRQTGDTTHKSNTFCQYDHERGQFVLVYRSSAFLAVAFDW